MLMGCSSTPPELRSDERDPYENANRKVFEFNIAVDDYALEPISKGYRATPDGVQTSLTNFARWTSQPSTVINSTLQGEFENGALATIDFLMNALTFGFFDITEDNDNPESKDFGQTLAAWNVPQGNYLVLPLFGSGTTRSHAGTLVDSVINPLGFTGEPTANIILTASTPASIITFRGNNYEQINDVKYNAIDPYAKTRSLYFQYREGQIIDLNPEVTSNADKVFDEFFDDN
jgi:phospholipid-binding lipoprotein MlaA